MRAKVCNLQDFLLLLRAIIYILMVVQILIKSIDVSQRMQVARTLPIFLYGSLSSVNLEMVETSSNEKNGTDKFVDRIPLKDLTAEKQNINEYIDENSIRCRPNKKSDDGRSLGIDRAEKMEENDKDSQDDDENLIRDENTLIR